MEKDNFSVVSGHSSRYMPSPSQLSRLNSNCDSSVSSVLRNTTHFSHDMNQMPESLQRNVGHRRSHSEILSLPDDITFDGDLGHLVPSLLDESEFEEDSFSMYLDMDKFASSSLLSGSSSGAIHSRMEDLGVSTNDRPRGRHQHSQSMDGSSWMKQELLGSGSEGPSLAETKKALSAANLADIAIVDPKRAKRIWANRQSAARSKERKMRYIAELEWKVQNLQTEATTLNAQLSMLQRDTTGLTTENNELKLQVQSVEQQVNLQEALNDALREEVRRLKATNGPSTLNGRHVPLGSSTISANPKFHRSSQASLMTARQFQQLQIHSQTHQRQFLPPSENIVTSLAPREGTSFNNPSPRNE